jgi:hypothetical protein
MQIAAAEEGARLVAKELAKGVQVQVTPALKKSSKVIRLFNVKIPATIVEELGSGQLKELIVKSAGKDYVLRVYSDGQELYHNSYTWFESISQTVEEIDAFEEDGTYVLRLSDIHFTEKLTIIAEPAIIPLTASTTLQEVFCKLDVFD